VYNFRVNSYERGKPEFTGTIFPITLMTSERPVEVGAPGCCPAGPILNLALIVCPACFHVRKSSLCSSDAVTVITYLIWLLPACNALCL